MNVPGVSERPATLPALFFAAGIAIAPVVVAPPATACACFVLAILLIRLRSIPYAILSLCLGAGVAIGYQATADDQRYRDLAKQSERFSTVAVPLNSSWIRTETGFRLTAPTFQVGDEQVNRNLTAYVAAEPPHPGAAAIAVIEGFLKQREDGSFTLICKSPRLVAYRGQASPLHPRYWNRRSDEELTKLALERPRHQRAIALAKALALGRSGDLPADVREDYRRGGTYHLLVFSGMQIAFAAAAVAFLLRGRSSRIKDVALLVLALLAPLFAGNEPSVSRAALMIGLFSATRLLKRPTPLENLFFVSAALRLAFVPQELSDPGFALTYAATGGLLFIGRPLARSARRRVVAAALYSLGAEIATLPLTLRFFHQYVAGGSIVTLLLAPVLGAMFLASSAACAAAILNTHFASAALYLVGALDSVATAVNRFCGEELRLARVGLAPPVWLLVSAYAAVVLLLSRRSAAVLLSCGLLLAPLGYSLVRSRALARVPHPEIHFLDVGQGDAILIRSGRATVLVDTGGRRGDPEFARRVLLPKLLDRGIRSLDAVLVTHPHPDHCGALVSLLETISIREVWLAAAHLDDSCAADGANLAFKLRIPVRLVRSHTVLPVDSIYLHLLPAERPFKRAALNNSSIVIAADVGRRRVLLTGDIERERESHLLSAGGSHLRSTVLKIAHHGSRTSTTQPFLDEVSPAIAVLSCGRANPFGHPHPAVVDRLHASRVRVWRTDENGDVRITFSDGAVRVSPEIDTPQGAP